MNQATTCGHKPEKIKAVYLMNASDVVIENGVMTRMKRKYGKFKRPVFKIESEKNEESYL